jgi:hypothetical protein
MRSLTNAEASEFLAARGFRIGGWNELLETNTDKTITRQCAAPVEARELFNFAQHLMAWLSPKESDWFFLQIDNSTSPLEGEVGVFENLVLSNAMKWNVGHQHSFLFDKDSVPDAGSSVIPALVMLVFFALAFEWHIYLVAEKSGRGQKLGLLDGVAYLFGTEEIVRQAKID